MTPLLRSLRRTHTSRLHAPHAIAALLAVIFTSMQSSRALAESPSAPGAAPIVYPTTRTVDVVDDYFGRKVADPYRWLENLDSPETAAWIAAQNKVTFAYLDKLPDRDAIRKRLTELWDFRRTEVPVLEAGQIWFAQNSGLQRQSPVYRQSGFDAKPELVIDPNVLSPDGSIAMGQWSPSPDGRFLAYTRAAGGSDVEDIHVRDLSTGQDLPRPVLHTKFGGIAWTHDSQGFFYSRYKGTETDEKFADAGRFHQVWYHDLDSATPDRLVFERPDHPADGTFASISDDGRWLFLYAGSGTTNNRLWVTDLGSPSKPNLGAPPIVLAPEEDAIHVPLGVIGRTVIPVHDVPRAEGTHRRGRRGRDRSRKVAHDRPGSEGPDCGCRCPARRRSSVRHLPGRRTEPDSAVRARWHTAGRNPAPRGRLGHSARRT